MKMVEHALWLERGLREPDRAPHRFLVTGEPRPGITLPLSRGSGPGGPGNLGLAARM